MLPSEAIPHFFVYCFVGSNSSLVLKLSYSPGKALPYHSLFIKHLKKYVPNAWLLCVTGFIASLCLPSGSSAHLSKGHHSKLESLPRNISAALWHKNYLTGLMGAGIVFISYNDLSQFLSLCKLSFSKFFSLIQCPETPFLEALFWETLHFY